MMLQLVQSPSQRIQRLIRRHCLDKNGKKYRDNKEHVASSNYEPVTGDRKQASSNKLDQETATSESRVDEVSSIVSSRSSSSSEGPNAISVEKILDRDNGVLVASSSYSSSKARNDGDRGRDEVSLDDDGDDDDDVVVDDDGGDADQ